MPELREVLAGFGEVRTYVQSGNVVLAADLDPEQVRTECERLIAQRFGFSVDVVVRTGAELAEVVQRNPLKGVADNPKRYQVTFLRSELPAQRVAELGGLATSEERVAVEGREVYAWHPAGAARSKLWAKLASPGLGVVATSRNWTTVQTLAEWAAE